MYIKMKLLSIILIAILMNKISNIIYNEILIWKCKNYEQIYKIGIIIGEIIMLIMYTIIKI